MDNFKERSYQTFLIQKAKGQNIVACLPTGSGKTFIALQLIKHYLHDAIKNKKKIVFLANTLPLVNQQAVYFCSELSNSFASDECRQAVVECFTSERNVDKWEKDKWDSILANCHVMVMISKVMQDALDHKFIAWKDVIFLILDECHHADKNHDMNNVMKSYLEAKSQKLTLPRVLGLTATILNGKKANSKVAKEVEAAEKRLDSRALTFPEYEEVLKESTSATLDFVPYSSSTSKYLLNKMDHEIILSSLEEFKRVMYHTNEKLFERDYVSEINKPSLKDNKQVYSSKKSVVKTLESIIEDVLGVYKDLGPYCAKIAAVTKRAFIQLIPSAKFKNKYVKHLYYGLDTALVTFISKLERLMCPLSKADQLNMFISDKVQQVLDVIVKFSQDDVEELCGIVFVEKRITAQALAFYLQDISALSTFSFMKADFVIGSSQFQQDSQDMRVTTKRQADVIKKFHAKTVNLLIATNVIEEGLNVPDCNLVLRFDEIKTYPSYVQSMGRARKKNSKFYCLILDETADKLQAAYKSFDECNKILALHLQRQALHPDKEGDDEDNGPDDIIPPFEPFGVGKPPKITAIESISIATRYCQTLACDRLVTLNPVSWWEEVLSDPDIGTSMFKAYIQFPANAVIREVEGDVHETKVVAKRSAFLKACKLLYEHNALDPEHLLPYSRSQNLENITNKYMDSIKIEQDASGKKTGSSNRRQQYRRKLPNCLEMTTVLPKSTICKVYQIVLEQVGEKDDEVSKALYQFSKRKFSYAFLTPLDFSSIPKFHLEVNSTVGFIAVTLREIPLNVGVGGNYYCYSPSSSELERLEGFERYIMGDVLKLKRDIMRNSTTPFLVVPLRKTVSSCFQEEFQIDWDLIDKVGQVNTSPSSSFREMSVEEKRQQSKFKFNADDFEDAVVMPNYKGGDEKELYVVMSVCHDLTPLSPFIDCTNYMTYFMKKYPTTVGTITDPHQCLLKVKGVAANLNFFTRKRSNQKSQQKTANVSELIPELCTIHSLSASLFIQAKFLPSICHRIIRFLCAKEIQEFVREDAPWASTFVVDDSEVSPAKKMKRNDAFENDTTTTGYYESDVDVKSDGELDADEDMEIGENNFKSKIVASIQEEEEEDHGGLEDIHPNELSRAQIQTLRSHQKNEQDLMDNDCLAFSREKQTDIKLVDINSLELKSFASCPLGEPSMETIMEAITLENAQDCYSLERLETMGDAFLKYCVSRHLFCHFHSFDEGKMTHWKSTLVSNAYLYQMAKSTEIKLGEFLAGGYFFPKDAWLPLTFAIPSSLAEAAARNDVNEDIYLDENTVELESKSGDELDDFIMDKMSEMRTSMQPHVGYTHARIPDKYIADSVEALIGSYYISGGCAGALHFMKRLGLRGPTNNEDEEGVPFGTWEIPNPKIKLRDSEKHHWDEFFPRKDELESIICYEFKDPWILAEAFTHASYSSNTVTGSYERLEFLGDAVLDFLVTDHIYNNSKKRLTPGQLTDLRSALVNNVTFASLAVRYGLDKYLLRTSKTLDDSISAFVKCQEVCGHQVKGHFTMLSETDCGSKTLLVKDIEVPKALGDIFESLAGAVFLDCGMDLDTVWRVFYRLMKNEIDLFSSKVPKSPVRELHELFTGRELFSTLSAQESKLEGEEMGRNLTFVRLTIPIPMKMNEDESNYKIIIGAGHNKQSAKIGAAKFALKILRGFI